MSHYPSTMAAMAARQNAEKIEDVDLDDPAVAELAEEAIDAAIAAGEVDSDLLPVEPESAQIPDIDVGTVVVYISRPGHGRMGRSEFPAVVTNRNLDDGSLGMVVIMEAEDLMTEDRVHAQINPDDRHCWRHVRKDGVLDNPTIVTSYDDLREEDDQRDGLLDVSPVSELAGLVRELGDQMLVMKDQMFGEYVAPRKSMMDYLADFDARIRAMEQKAPVAAVTPKRRGRPPKKG